MATLNDLTTGIAGRLSNGFGAGNLWTPNQGCLAAITVLVQDYADITNKIDIAIGRIGMLALINMPGFTNHDPLSDLVNAKIHLFIEIGEQPVIWRDNPLTKPKAVDVAQLVARLVQGFYIAGFEKLRVLKGDFSAGRDKANRERQVYSVEVETMQLFDASP
jgi:hypothetical protein